MMCKIKMVLKSSRQVAIIRKYPYSFRIIHNIGNPNLVDYSKTARIFRIFGRGTFDTVFRGPALRYFGISDEHYSFFAET